MSLKTNNFVVYLALCSCCLLNFVINVDWHLYVSLRSKRFHEVGEQRKTKERYFAPEPQGNACYEGYLYAGTFLSQSVGEFVN